MNPKLRFVPNLEFLHRYTPIIRPFYTEYQNHFMGPKELCCRHNVTLTPMCSKQSDKTRSVFVFYS